MVTYSIAFMLIRLGLIIEIVGNEVMHVVRSYVH